MKTAREWFEMFPEPYRTQALANLKDDPELYRNAHRALDHNFDWEASPEGEDYWYELYRKLTLEDQ